MAGARFESPTIQLAALFLGTIGLACVATLGLLTWNGSDAPDALSSIAGGAVGALSTLLTTFAPSPLPGGRRVTDAEAARRRLFAESEPAAPAEPPPDMSPPIP